MIGLQRGQSFSLGNRRAGAHETNAWSRWRRLQKPHLPLNCWDDGRRHAPSQNISWSLIPAPPSQSCWWSPGCTEGHHRLQWEARGLWFVMLRNSRIRYRRETPPMRRAGQSPWLESRSSGPLQSRTRSQQLSQLYRSSQPGTWRPHWYFRQLYPENAALATLRIRSVDPLRSTARLETSLVLVRCWSGQSETESSVSLNLKCI